MTKRGATIVEKAVAQFIRSLQERNASPHTIKAYRTDLAQFAEYVGPQSWSDIDHVLIRGYLSSLYERGLSKTSVARALAALRSLYKWLAQEGEVEQNPAACWSHAEAAEKTAARAHHGGGEHGARWSYAGDASAFPERDRHDFRAAVWLRHPQLGAGRHQRRRHPAGRTNVILVRGKGRKQRYVPFGDSAAMRRCERICRHASGCWAKPSAPTRASAGDELARRTAIDDHAVLAAS